MVINREIIEEIVKCAKKVSSNGIYVPCNVHPCGWDFISFKYMVMDGITNNTWGHEFDLDEISNDIYDSHPFENKKLKEILEETKGKYAFEIDKINW